MSDQNQPNQPNQPSQPQTTSFGGSGGFFANTTGNMFSNPGQTTQANPFAGGFAAQQPPKEAGTSNGFSGLKIGEGASSFFGNNTSAQNLPANPGPTPTLVPQVTFGDGNQQEEQKVTSGDLGQNKPTGFNFNLGGQTGNNMFANTFTKPAEQTSTDASQNKPSMFLGGNLGSTQTKPTENASAFDTSVKKPETGFNFSMPKTDDAPKAFGNIFGQQGNSGANPFSKTQEPANPSNPAPAQTTAEPKPAQVAAPTSFFGGVTVGSNAQSAFTNAKPAEEKKEAEKPATNLTGTFGFPQSNAPTTFFGALGQKSEANANQTNLADVRQSPPIELAKSQEAEKPVVKLDANMFTSLKKTEGEPKNTTTTPPSFFGGQENAAAPAKPATNAEGGESKLNFGAPQTNNAETANIFGVAKTNPPKPSVEQVAPGFAQIKNATPAEDPNQLEKKQEQRLLNSSRRHSDEQNDRRVFGRVEQSDQRQHRLLAGNRHRHERE